MGPGLAGSLAAAGGQTALRSPPGCPRDVSSGDVGGVPVEAGPSPVVAHGGARVRVRGRFLHVPQRDPAARAMYAGEIYEKMQIKGKSGITGHLGAAASRNPEMRFLIPLSGVDPRLQLRVLLFHRSAELSCYKESHKTADDMSGTAV